jgi:osmotically-inducible protein OsmY
MKTDAQLKRDVDAELDWEPSVNAEHIGIEVRDGVVTLAGHVGSFGEKWGAERAAQRVSGVRALAVEIDVNLLGSNKRSDADIARSVENVLQWTTNLPVEAVKVKVEHGFVSLSGDVEWDYQRQAATKAVRYLMGVTGVSDNMGIKVGPSSTDVKADIEAALQRRAIDDGENIVVDVIGSTVTLSGFVHNLADRYLATNCAWGATGVSEVVNNMTVGE